MQQQACVEIGGRYMIELINHMGYWYVRAHGEHQDGEVLVKDCGHVDAEAELAFEVIVELAEEREAARK